MKKIEYAQLIWQESGPVSSQFDDIYYSKVSGLEESKKVFIEQSQLAKRWLHSDHCTIVETGFGTGLNFLLVWQLWRKLVSRQEKKSLHFISIEKYPLAHTDLALAFSQWPELAAYSQRFNHCYSTLRPGENYFEFDQKQVCVTLHIGDISDALPLLGEPVDVWFLDGFAPNKNPQMWSGDLFDTMGKLTRQGGSFATFSAASAVRRGLVRAGFNVEKVPGFAGKREMMRGVKEK